MDTSILQIIKTCKCIVKKNVRKAYRVLMCQYMLKLGTGGYPLLPAMECHAHKALFLNGSPNVVSGQSLSPYLVSCLAKILKLFLHKSIAKFDKGIFIIASKQIGCIPSEVSNGQEHPLTLSQIKLWGIHFTIESLSKTHKKRFANKISVCIMHITKHTRKFRQKN